VRHIPPLDEALKLKRRLAPPENPRIPSQRVLAGKRLKPLPADAARGRILRENQ